MSLNELSKRSGVNLSTLQHWEYEEIMPTLDNFIKAIAALGYELKIVPKEGL